MTDRYLLRSLELPLDFDLADVDALAKAVARRIRVSPQRIAAPRIVRRSIDARTRRGAPRLVVHVLFAWRAGPQEQSTPASIDESPPPEEATPSTTSAGAANVAAGADEAGDAGSAAAEGPPLGRDDLVPHEETPPPMPVGPPAVHSTRAGAEVRGVVVGAGPAGLLGAIALAEAGWRPVLLERGGPAEERGARVGRFWSAGELDPECNVLFGEGGAGLFSDGKLTTRTKDRARRDRVLRLFVEAGAPADILVDAEPHLGTDGIRAMLPHLRRRLEEAGGEVRFHARVTGLECGDGRLRGVRLAGGEVLEAGGCLLAPGHSARDLLPALATAGVRIDPKPFAVGVRLEMPQERIDRTQWGAAAGHPRLGAASFRLTRRPARGAKACYSFCMCPGGEVIACASEPGRLTTNGMSRAARAGAWGNAAFLVPVEAAPEGIERQRALEEAAFQAGGGEYALPATSLSAFLAGRRPTRLPPRPPGMRAVPAMVRDLLPPDVAETLAIQIPAMLRPFRDLDPEAVTVYGVETRSSGPMRILRNPEGESPALTGLFPAGEGAGYAGGIMSSAIDGLRAAEQLAVRLREIAPE